MDLDLGLTVGSRPTSTPPPVTTEWTDENGKVWDNESSENWTEE